jgi:hypothetical protein
MMLGAGGVTDSRIESRPDDADVDKAPPQPGDYVALFALFLF